MPKIAIKGLNIVVTRSDCIASFAVKFNNALFVNGWRLILRDCAYVIKPPLERYTNKNGQRRKKKQVVILDEKLNRAIIRLAVSEYTRKCKLLENELDTIDYSKRNYNDFKITL